MSNPQVAEEREELLKAIRAAKCTIIGAETLTNPGEIVTCAAIIKAFGDDGTSFVYARPALNDGSSGQMPDIVLGSLTTGILCFEAKGHQIDQIARVAAGHIHVSYNGRTEEESVAKQAEDAMYNVKGSLQKILRDEEIFIDFRVLFPFITLNQWTDKGFEKAMLSEGVCIPKDILQHPKQLKETLEKRSQGSKGWKLRTPTSESILSVRAAFGDSAVLKDRRDRAKPSAPESLGAKIHKRATSEKRLSDEQQDLGRKSFEWNPQLIRGVAGSGKSKVLCLNLAHYLRRRYDEQTASLFEGKPPKRRCAALCFNQALVPVLKEDVKTSYEQLTGKEWDTSFVDLFIGHVNGFMYHLSGSNRKNPGPLTYVPTDEFKDAGEDASGLRAQEYIKQLQKLTKDQLSALQFDTIYVDEAQDLHPKEIDLLVGLCKQHAPNKEPNLVVFYDDAQNVYGRQRPVWADHGLRVNVGDRSRVMRECFRNSSEVVNFSFNVLLGTGASSGIKADTRKFADVEYLTKQKYADGLPLIEEQQDRWKVNFAKWPEPYYQPEVKRFKSRHEELEWLAQTIKNLIEKDQVVSQDILVLSENHKVCEEAQKHINSKSGGAYGVFTPHLLQQSEKGTRHIAEQGKVTVTTTRTAKGHEAYVVFVVGTETFPVDTKGRASFYVACTRSRLKLYISGVGDRDYSLLDESDRVRRMLFPD